jgi:drug/metabolite transporter (DMT)-like permease
MKKALFQMHLAVLLWGITAVLGRAIDLSAPVLVWYRMLMTALFMAGILYYRKGWVPVEKNDRSRLFSIGLLIAVHWVAFYGSIKFSNASVALVCLSTASIFTPLLDQFINKTKHKPAELLLGLLAMAGVYLIYRVQELYALGVLFGVIAALLSSWFTVLNKKIAHKYPARTMVFYEMSAGWLLITLLVPLQVMFSPEPVDLMPTNYVWLWLVVLSLCCTVWAQSLALNALKHISSFTSSLSLNLEPVYGIILAFIFFKEYEMLRPEFYMGLTLILSSVLIQMVMLLKPGKKQPSIVEDKSGID